MRALLVLARSWYVITACVAQIMPYCITGLHIPDDMELVRVFTAFADFCVLFKEALHTEDCLRLVFDVLEKYALPSS
jgi:hypothetical protein